MADANVSVDDVRRERHKRRAERVFHAQLAGFAVSLGISLAVLPAHWVLVVFCWIASWTVPAVAGAIDDRRSLPKPPRWTGHLLDLHFDDRKDPAA